MNTPNAQLQEKVEDAFYNHACARCEALPESVVDDEMRELIFEEDIVESICDECDECNECCVC